MTNYQKGEEEIQNQFKVYMSKLDLERLILVLRTCFVQNCDKIFPYFIPNVYALAFLRICSNAPVNMY